MVRQTATNTIRPEAEFEYEGDLYLPLETAKKYYIVKKEWIEELD